MANKLDSVISYYRFDASISNRVFTLMVLDSLDIDYDWGEQFNPDRDFLRRMQLQVSLSDDDYSRKVPTVIEAMPIVHSFGLKEGGEDVSDLVCKTCGVSITDCGATEESWYCKGKETEDDGAQDRTDS